MGGSRYPECSKRTGSNSVWPLAVTQDAVIECTTLFVDSFDCSTKSWLWPSTSLNEHITGDGSAYPYVRLVGTPQELGEDAWLMQACVQKLIETSGVIVSLRVALRAAVAIVAARLWRARAQLFFSTGLPQSLVAFKSVVRSSPSTRFVGRAQLPTRAARLPPFPGE